MIDYAERDNAVICMFQEPLTDIEQKAISDCNNALKISKWSKTSSVDYSEKDNAKIYVFHEPLSGSEQKAVSSCNRAFGATKWKKPAANQTPEATADVVGDLSEFEEIVTDEEQNNILDGFEEIISDGDIPF